MRTPMKWWRLVAALMLVPALMLPAGCGWTGSEGRTPTSEPGPAPVEPTDGGHDGGR